MVFYTDGACSRNPGPGGFGVVSLLQNKIVYTYHHNSENTTNNREELKAILYVFKLVDSLNIKEDVIIYSDSAYAVNMLKDWIWTWANNDWKNSKKQTVENLDLVKELYNYINKDFFPCQVIKIRGHVGEAGNELADALAAFNETKFNNIKKKFLLTEERDISFEKF